jgi:hypothetical protein
MSVFSETLKATKAAIAELRALPDNAHRNALHGINKRLAKAYIAIGYIEIETNAHGCKRQKGARMASDLVYNFKK